MVDGPRAWMRLLATAFAAAAMAAVAPPAAHADFTETFCAGGAAPAPWIAYPSRGAAWVEQTDNCSHTDGSFYGFDNISSSLPNAVWAAGIQAPAGEQLSHVNLTFRAQPATSGVTQFQFGYDGVVLDYGAPSSPEAIQTSDYPLPDASVFWFDYSCNTGSCQLPDNLHTFEVGALNVTIHDTGAPSVSPTGGSLAANGATVRGTQTLLFHATAGGSGVAKATVSLGSTIVGETDVACQSASMTPCPGDSSGTIAANTAAVPDGTYPVIVTAYNASGTGTPAQAGTVIVANHAGSTSLPSPRPTRRHHGRRRVNVHIVFDWDVQRTTTLLRRVHVGRISRRVVIHLTCTGRHCPFRRLTARPRTVAALTRRLAHRRFRPGQELHYLATAPHRAPQRATVTIRSTRLPRISSR